MLVCSLYSCIYNRVWKTKRMTLTNQLHPVLEQSCQHQHLPHHHRHLLVFPEVLYIALADCPFSIARLDFEAIESRDWLYSPSRSSGPSTGSSPISPSSSLSSLSPPSLISPLSAAPPRVSPPSPLPFHPPYPLPIFVPEAAPKARMSGCLLNNQVSTYHFKATTINRSTVKTQTGQQQQYRDRFKNIE